jgi:hypothetical protein
MLGFALAGLDSGSNGDLYEEERLPVGGHSWGGWFLQIERALFQFPWTSETCRFPAFGEGYAVARWL